MATASFDKIFVIDKLESQKKLYDIIDGRKKSQKQFTKIYTHEDEKRSELALRQLVSILRA